MLNTASELLIWKTHLPAAELLANHCSFLAVPRGAAHGLYHCIIHLDIHCTVALAEGVIVLQNYFNIVCKENR